MCTNQFKIATETGAPPFFDFAELLLCLNMSELAHLAIYTSFSGLVILTHVRMLEFTWRVCTDLDRRGISLFLSEDLSSFVAWFLRGLCVPRRRSVLPSSGMREKTIVMVISGLRHCFLKLLWKWQKLHESPLELCPCAFHWKHSPTFLSSQAFIPFWLLVTDLRSTTPSQTLTFRVLIIWSTWSFTDVFKVEKFGCPLFRAVSFQGQHSSKSWTESSSSDLYRTFQNHFGKHVTLW